MKITTQQIKAFLLQEGFTDQGGDDEGEMYTSDYIGVFVRKGFLFSASLSWGFSSDGYYEIENATYGQIVAVIAVFKKAKFIDTTEGK